MASWKMNTCDRDSGRYGEWDEMRETAETEFSISELKRDSFDPLGFFSSIYA